MVERFEKEPKTLASERDIPLLPMALAAVDWANELTGPAGDKIFWNPRSGKPIRDYEESSRCFKIICAKAGVRYRNQYQTRHSFCSNLLSEGENPLKVSHWMGHKNLKMVFEVYAKYIDQGKRAIETGEAVKYGEIAPGFARYLRAERFQISK